MKSYIFRSHQKKNMAFPFFLEVGLALLSLKVYALLILGF